MKNIHRIILVAIIAAIVAFNYYGEYCAHCDGYGWDGCFTYRAMVLNGWDEYASGCISDYHSHRMLHFLIIHYIIKAFSLPFSPHNVMLTCSIANTVMLAVAVFFFFRISNKEGWKRRTEIIVFSFLFFNFHVLKFMGYCPVMTDMPAFALCVALVYYCVSKNKVAVVVTGLISVVVFPILSLMAFLMLCLPDEPLRSFSDKEKDKEGYNANRILNATMRCLITVWLPLAFVTYIFFRLYVKNVGDYKSVFIARYPENIYISVAAILAYVIFYWFATSPLQVDFLAMLKPFRERRRIFLSIVAVVAFVAIYTLPTVLCYKGNFSLVNEFAQICQFPATDILIFLETPFVYLGLGFVFLMIKWKSVCRETMARGTGVYAILILAVVFLADIETRKIIYFYIFLLPMLAKVIEKLNISRARAITIVAIQLFLSFFWFRINVDGIKEAFATYDNEVYMQMPAQRYYMFQGPWQSHEMYLTFMFVALIFFFAYRGILKTESSCGETEENNKTENNKLK